MTAATEKLLTPDNCVIAFIDQQPQMSFGVQSHDRQVIKNNTVGLARAARIFGVPTVLTTVETESFSGYTWPELVAALDGQQTVERSSMNSWEDEGFVAAIQMMIQAGAKPRTWQQVLLEFQRDWSRKETYDAVIELVRDAGGAYGMGTDYAATMVHKAPQRGDYPQVIPG